MKLKTVGTVIATRELALDGGQHVQVLVGKPEPFPDGQDWYCPYQVVGIGAGRVWSAGGVDAVQALILALQSIGAVLVCSREYHAGRLNWDAGSVKGDLGFPLPKSLSDLAPSGAIPQQPNPKGGAQAGDGDQ
jgi:hypothetical protein